MPFHARQDGMTVIPEDVSDGENVHCLDCGEIMRARGPFEDGRARHFYHIADVGGNCNHTTTTAGPAESPTHKKLKSLAVSGLRHHFEGMYGRCEPEIAIDVAKTVTNEDQRRADALLEFTEPNRFYGKGLIIEVQHLNAGKDVRATTHDYLKQDYSVYWATVDDFADDRFLVEAMETAFNNQKDAAFAAYRSSPPPLESPEPLISPANNSPYTTSDPVPECAHELVPGEDTGRICVRCGLKFETCVFDDNRGFLRRSDTASSALDGPTVLAADKESIEHPVEVQPVEEHEDPPDHMHHWGHGTDIFAGMAYRCSWCGSRMVVISDKIMIRNEESNQWRPRPRDLERFDNE